MRRFLVQICIFLLLMSIFPLGSVAVRFDRGAKDVADSMQFDPRQKILFIGDSHIGCTFVEDDKYENCVLWESSMPQQFTLMRLRDMEKKGVLSNIELIVLDIGLQSIGQQRRERMKEFWWRMIPIAVRHNDVLPLSVWDKLDQLVKNPRGRIHIKEDMPTANVSVLTRPLEVREGEFLKIAEAHFNWINKPDEMCKGWEKSLTYALNGICEICARNDIPLIFITAPLTSYYVNAIPEDVNKKLEEFTDIIMDKGVPYYDLRDWGEDDDFRDCFHFRVCGAIKFTEWFYEEIIPKWRKFKSP